MIIYANDFSIDSKKRIHLVYKYTIDYNVHHKYSDDGGISWTDEIIGKCLQYSLKGASSTLDSFDNIHVVFVDENNRISYIRYSDGWSIPYTIANPDIYNNSYYHLYLISDSSDNLHLVYIKYNDIYYTKYTTSWSEPITVDNIYDIYENAPLLLSDSLNNIYLFYQQYIYLNGAAGVDIVFRKYDGAFGPPIHIARNMSIDHNANGYYAIIDRNNVIHIIYDQVYGDAYFKYLMYMSYRNDSWSTPIVLTTLDSSNYEIPRLFIDNDVLYAIWTGGPSENYNYSYRAQINGVWTDMNYIKYFDYSTDLSNLRPIKKIEGIESGPIIYFSKIKYVSLINSKMSFNDFINRTQSKKF